MASTPGSGHPFLMLVPDLTGYESLIFSRPLIMDLGNKKGDRPFLK
jgi:hypothetical protein